MPATGAAGSTVVHGEGCDRLSAGMATICGELSVHGGAEDDRFGRLLRGRDGQIRGETGGDRRRGGGDERARQVRAALGDVSPPSPEEVPERRRRTSPRFSNVSTGFDGRGSPQGYGRGGGTVRLRV